MTESIIVALITGGLAFIGTLLSVSAGNDKIFNEMKTQQAVTDTKIEELTREVRKHNNFAERIPVLEEQVRQLEKITH